MAKSSKIGYLGPAGTYSHAAAAKWFGDDAVLVPLPSIGAVFEEHHQGHVEHGIVPIENSTEGAVRTTLDCFITYRPLIPEKARVKIIGEMLMEIELNLLGTAETRLEDVRTVYAHEQAIAQARNWLDRTLPKAATVAMSSNAAAAQKVSDDPSSAAIASRYAAEIYGLNVLEPGIQDASGNTTRFVVLGQGEPPPSADGAKDKTSMLAATAHEPGTLLKLLKPLSKHGINMTLLESRPAPDTKWEYEFFIEVEGHHKVEPLKSALDDMAGLAKIDVLGSYPAAA